MPDFNQTLGMRRESDGAIALETRPEHEVVAGTIHFAVLATLAEVAAAGAVGGPVVPVALQLQLLQRAAPGRLVARGTLLRRGGRLAFAEGTVLQDGAPVAKAAVTFALPRPA